MLTTSLDIARGLAALWVFAYHLRYGIAPGAFRQFADAGFLGVPAFFVISGYCMMASGRGALAGRHSAVTFLKRRMRRIFPPFWASIPVVIAIPFLAAVFGAISGGGLRWPHPGWREFSLVDWLALTTLTKGLFIEGAAHKPWRAVNPVYWSLAIEVQFYLVMFLALVFRRRYSAILAAVTACCAAFWALAGAKAPGIFLVYWPMFALGLLLHAVLEKGFRPSRFFGSRSAQWSILVFAAGIAAAVGQGIYAPGESLGRQTIFAALCALILWAASGIEPYVPKDGLILRGFVLLGAMSYSIYLLHVHVVALVPTLYGAGIFKPLFTIAASLPLVYLFHRWFEKPYTGRRTSNHTPENSPSRQAVPAAASVE